MKYLILFCLVVIYTIAWGQDMIYLKNGDIYPAKVNKSSEDGIVANLYEMGKFGRPKLSKEPTIYNLSDVYMIKYQSRGNVYFFADNTRKQDENQKIEKGANLIYLVEGKEIPAWDIEVQGTEIKYRKTKEKKQALSNTQILDSEKVFMILYVDGSKDIITDLSKPKEDNIDPQTEIEVKEEPQFKVIFHTVKSGETLTSIAQQYSVSVVEVRIWNDIPTTTKDTTKLKAGQQLLIQQLIK